MTCKRSRMYFDMLSLAHQEVISLAIKRAVFVCVNSISINMIKILAASNASVGFVLCIL